MQKQENTMLIKILALIMLTALPSLASAQKKYHTYKKLQYVSCNDSVLMQQISNLAFSDSIDSFVRENIFPNMDKSDSQYCRIAILPREDCECNNSNSIINQYDVSRIIQVQLIYCSNLQFDKYYTQYKGTTFIIDNDFGSLFDNFFTPEQTFKTFDSYSVNRPLTKDLKPKEVDIKFDLNPVYVFLYVNGKLILEPCKEIWDWANG